MLAALGAASTVAIMVLHGHECSGDGCLLCLAATWAHALLCLCVGMSVARPIVRVLMRACVMRVLRTLWQDTLPIGKYPTELPL